MEYKLATGGKIVDKDPRDYRLEAVGADVPIPVSFRPDYSSIPVDMQGQQPACGAHADTSLEGVYKLKEGITAPHFSPRFAWTEIKKVDGFPLEDGTTINAALNLLTNVGICDFSLTGNDVSLSLQDYANLAITPEMISNASPRKALSYATTYNPTFNQLKQAIYVHGAVLMLMRVGENMYTNPQGIASWGSDILPLSTKYPFDGGHFVTAIGYDQNYIYFRNSWSTAWGINGDGFIDASYISYVVAIGTIIDPSVVTPAVNPNTTWYQKFIYLLKSAGIYQGN